ncbi:MAG: hypothetical protein GXW89_06440 [Phycisphaerae bacterium]|nr:hypothetical protein [Phycisphaerae bacterium]
MLRGDSFLTGIFVVAGAGLSLGATNVSPVFKFGWGENIGWLNWRDADGGAAGVRVHATFLSGFIWGENVGWINLGDRPADGMAYQNAPSADFGVNIDPTTGNLFGLAWGENIGWINFDMRAALGPTGQQARLDYTASRLRGYVWGENVGWINLDGAAVYVAWMPPAYLTIFADPDDDYDVDQEDFGVFQACFSGAGVPAADGCERFDRPQAGFPRGDNDVDEDDLAAFLACVSGPAVPLNEGCAN